MMLQSGNKQESNEVNFLSINNICKEFDCRSVLRSVSFQLHEGDFLSIFGPNGAGKSTLLNIIATLTKPSTGTIEVNGFDLVEEPASFRKNLGVISHHSLLYDRMTARENLIFYAKMYHQEKPEQKADQLLDLVGLYERRNSETGSFSRGMRQRLSIARALVNDPVILLLDEPYSGLDQHASSILTDHLHQLMDRARTIIMVTHNLMHGLNTASRVGIMAKGRMIHFSDRRDVSSHTFEKYYLEQISGVGTG